MTARSVSPAAVPADRRPDVVPGSGSPFGPSGEFRPVRNGHGPRGRRCGALRRYGRQTGRGRIATRLPPERPRPTDRTEIPVPKKSGFRFRARPTRPQRNGERTTANPPRMQWRGRRSGQTGRPARSSNSPCGNAGRPIRTLLLPTQPLSATAFEIDGCVQQEPGVGGSNLAVAFGQVGPVGWLDQGKRSGSSIPARTDGSRSSTSARSAWETHHGSRVLITTGRPVSSSSCRIRLITRSGTSRHAGTTVRSSGSSSPAVYGPVPAEGNPGKSG